MKLNFAKLLGLKMSSGGLFSLRRKTVLSLPVGRGLGGLSGVNAFKVASGKGKGTKRKTGIERDGNR